MTQCYFQAGFFVLSMEYYFIYLGYVKPLDSPSANVLEFINEGFSMVLAYHVLVFTDLIATPAI